MFEIGQHVICINDEHHTDVLTLNKVYTIKDIYKCTNRCIFNTKRFKSDILLVLEETSNNKIVNIKTGEIIISNEKSYGFGFNSERFKPLSKLTIDDFKDVSLPINEIIKEYLEFAN